MPSARVRIAVLAVALVAAIGVLALRPWEDDSFAVEMRARQTCAENPIEPPLPRTEDPAEEIDGLALSELFEIQGVITAIDVHPRSGAVLATSIDGVVAVFDPTTGDVDEVVNLRSRISRTGSEDGLIGAAWSPDGARAYLHFTDIDLVSTIEAYPVDEQGWGEPATVFTFQQPHKWHNGGQLTFEGDTLWLGVGDGGFIGDPGDTGQDPTDLFASILRFRVSEDGLILRPHPDNPYLGSDEGRDEVWATGLRNPWRFWIDRIGDRLIVADVGDACWDEISVVPLEEAGANFGWRDAEGPVLFDETDASADFVPPRFSYPHGEGACAVIGGVLAPATYPDLEGRYLFADFCGSELLALDVDGEDPPEPLGIGARGTTAFALDADGHVLLGDVDGRVLRLQPS